MLGGTFILGYEETANSGVIVPMQNTGTATSSANGILYSGTTSGSSGSGTINMSSVTITSPYVVEIAPSSVVDGAVTIKCGEYFIGNTNNGNNLKLFSAESLTTAFTPSVSANDVFAFTITANETYNQLQYNSKNKSERFVVYSGKQKNLVAYKKVGTSAEELFNNLATKSQLSFNYSKSIVSTENEMVAYTGETISANKDTNYVSCLNLDNKKWNVTSEKNDTSLLAGLNRDGLIKLYSKETTGNGTSIRFENISGALIESIIINKGDKGVLAVFAGNSSSPIDADEDGYYLINTNKFTIQNVSVTGSDTADIKSISVNVSTDVSYSIADDNGKSSVSINYGTFIEKGMYQSFKQCNARFGMFYAISELLENDTVASIIEDGLNDIEGFTIDDLKDYSVYYKICTPACVDSNGNASEDGTYYQYGVKISNISDGFFDQVISAVGFVEIDGIYYITKENGYSVNSLASVYANSEDKSSYMEHLGAIQWLSTHNE